MLGLAAVATPPARSAAPGPFPSTYSPARAAPLAIVHAEILTAAGPVIHDGAVLIAEGRISAVGNGVAIPPGMTVIDAKGRWVTPGIVDPHDHIGTGSSAGKSGDDANESQPDNAGIWIEHSIWPQDPMFDRTRRAGVTTVQILPGSANLFGGRTVVLKNVPSATVQGMKFPGAPYGLKMACGENVIGGSKGIRTRAGAMQGYRNAFIAAQEYGKRLDAAARKGGEPPRRDLMLETLSGVLRGDILVHIHCYRAEEMAQMLDLSHEFGFHITAFHHATEAFKITPLLVREKVAVVTWAGDWSGYKLEAYDSIMENAAFVERAGGLVTLHSDNPELMQHLNQEAGRAMTAGREAGLGTTPEQAIRWITLNPARILGVADKTGSLEVGKMADVVLWNTYPFSVYAAPDLVLIDGVTVVDGAHPPSKPVSDFELGLSRRASPKVSPVSETRP